MKYLVFFLLVCLLGWDTLHAQVFGGAHPARRWSQIHTDTARVIFPAGLDSSAQRVAAIVHRLAAARPYSLGGQLKKINIVLQHQTTIPNAYVGLGPYRSEFYLTPPAQNFDQGSIPWTDQLALHEYRHAQQFNNFNHGLSRLMRVLFGQEGYALAINAAIPDWFYEGDAVYLETQLTRQGRGRIPLFTNAFPSLWKAGKDYSWMKIRNGSLKDYVPDHYELGYLMVNYGREKYGPGFWQQVTRDASAYRGLFYPFQKAVRKYAGVDYGSFRREAFDFYRKKLDLEKENQEQFLLPVTKNYVTNYYYPQGNEDTLVYVKSSYRHRPAFYLRVGGRERRLRFRDISLDQQYSSRGGRIVYAAFENQGRWNWTDYSVIRVLDIASGKQRSITSRSRYFSPDLSPSGSRVVAVHQDSLGRSELHILGSGEGDLQASVHAGDVAVFTNPRFIDEDRIISAVRLRDGRMTLAISHLPTGSTTRLLPPSWNVIGNPWYSEGRVYFTASYGGNDDVYAFRPGDEHIYRVSRGDLGKYFPGVINGMVRWSAFTAEGYQLEQSVIDSSAWTAIPLDRFSDTSRIATGFSTLGEPGFLSSIGSSPDYPVDDYPKSTGLFNFHSWRPYYEDPIFTFSLFGENVLNTLQTELYYLYHQDEKTHAAGTSLIYGGLFPYIAAGTEFTFNRQGRVGNRFRNWNQLDSRIGFIIPYNKTSGQTFKNFSFSNYYFLREEYNRGAYGDSAGRTGFSYLLHSFNWSQRVSQAPQHIYPRLGWGLNAALRHAITRYEAYQFIANATLYLPGIATNHNLVLTGSFQQRDTSYVIFSNRFATARGYLSYYATNGGSRLTRVSADYHFPAWHPDFGFGNILYFLRLRGNVFYDQQQFYFNTRKKFGELRSTGLEVYVDTKWWNQYPLTFGVRVSRLLDNDILARVGKGSYIWEFIVPVAIIPR